MGMTLQLNPDRELADPPGFGGDTKQLVHLIIDDELMEQVREALDVETSALQKSCDGNGEWESIEDVYESLDELREASGDEDLTAEEVWEATVQQRETAWQPPGGLAAALEPIIEKLSDPSALAALADLLDEESLIEPEYVTDGELRQDLADLRNHALWYEKHGAERVRVEIA